MTRRLAIMAVTAAGAIAAATPVVASSPLNLYYERSLMVAANARCNLFSPDLAAALTAAQAQARNAALRAGAADAAVTGALSNARSRAGSVSCRSPDLAVASGRVRSAFSGFGRLQRMSYPGDAAAWQASRAGPADVMSWRLSQSVAFGRDRAVFGLGGRGTERQVLASASFADGAWPYAARLVIRDTARTPAPQVVRLTPGSPLPGRMAPRQGARIVMAEGRSLGEGAILPKGAKTGVVFRFPAETATLLDALDPREAIAVEFVFSGPRGDHVRSAYVEIGDFSAGQAFLAAAR